MKLSKLDNNSLRMLICYPQHCYLVNGDSSLPVISCLGCLPLQELRREWHLARVRRLQERRASVVLHRHRLYCILGLRLLLAPIDLHRRRSAQGPLLGPDRILPRRGSPHTLGLLLPLGLVLCPILAQGRAAWNARRGGGTGE